MANSVAYNADDPTQQGFLQALALGETGSSSFTSNAATGYGGTNLSGASTDQYGFPVWSGVGNTHAAGTFQFQPGTWDSIASTYGLNFSDPSDQAEGAWYLAQQVYSQKTGGSLETALQSGDYASVQSALGSTWTSVNGSGANPQGLAASLQNYIGNAAASIAAGASVTPGATASAASSNGSAASASTGGGLLSSLWGGVTDTFARGGLIVLGIVIILAALWALLSSEGYVPGPTKLVKDAL